MSSAGDFKVAIVGGGLCGLSLAIALKNRSVPFTIYEGRESFTELGAGINIGPNALTAFRLIDESLGEAIYSQCTRNAPGKEDVWFQLRFGAPSGKHADAELVTELMSPPTGNMTVSRNELLQKLAEMAGLENARFNKKLSGLDQDDDGVALTFADGTETRASVVVACDGIHSAARRLLLGEDHPAAVAQYSGSGAYRAVVPIEELQATIGTEMSRNSQILLGPSGYLIMYPIAGAQHVNVGAWTWRELWTGRNWSRPNQRKEMEKHFEKWGSTAHRIMDTMGDPPFLATYLHGTQPEYFSRGRVCLIGDAAHAMPPHQGAGASQAMEDAYVISEVVAAIDKDDPSRMQIGAAFKAYEAVRSERANRVKDTSHEAMNYWTEFYSTDISDEKLQHFIKGANDRFAWIWHDDIADQACRALDIMQKELR